MLPLDYSNKELIESIRQLMKRKLDITRMSLEAAGGGDRKTLEKYLSEDWLQTRSKLDPRTVKTLNEILETLAITMVDIEDFHRRRIEKASKSHAANTDKYDNNTHHESDTNNTQLNNGNFQPTINFNNNKIGTVVNGNQTVYKTK